MAAHSGPHYTPDGLSSGFHSCLRLHFALSNSGMGLGDVRKGVITDGAL